MASEVAVRDDLESSADEDDSDLDYDPTGTRFNDIVRSAWNSKRSIASTSRSNLSRGSTARVGTVSPGRRKATACIKGVQGGGGSVKIRSLPPRNPSSSDSSVVAVEAAKTAACRRIMKQEGCPAERLQTGIPPPPLTLLSTKANQEARRKAIVPMRLKEKRSRVNLSSCFLKEDGV
eukprot:jgi/Bigna1/81000/fgenesh1_pg.76_\